MAFYYKQRSLKDPLVQKMKIKFWYFQILTNVTILKQKHNFWAHTRAMVNHPHKALTSLKKIHLCLNIHVFKRFILNFKRYFSWPDYLQKSIWWEKSGTVQTVPTVPRAAPLQIYVSYCVARSYGFWRCSRHLWRSYNVINVGKNVAILRFLHSLHLESD